MKKFELMTLVCLVLLMTEPTWAQAIGGGGNFMGGFVNWVINNVIPAIGVVLIVAIGIGLAVSRVGGAVFAVCGIAGIWIAANAQTLYNTFIGG